MTKEKKRTKKEIYADIEKEVVIELEEHARKNQFYFFLAGMISMAIVNHIIMIKVL